MAIEKEVTVIKPLPNPIELAKESWLVYKARFWSVLGIGALGFLGVMAVLLLTVILGVGAYFLLGGKSQPLIGIGAVLILVTIAGISLLGNWISAAVTINIAHWEKRVGIKESYQLARPFIIPLLLTSLVSGLIILGAGLLLIIPALIFSVWFSFIQYSVVLDKKSGLAALTASREYIRGRFWQVLWLMVAVHLPEIVLGLVFSSGGSGKEGGDVSGILQIFSLFTFPFYQVYMYTLFLHLRKTTISLKDKSTNTPLSYIIVPALGYILLVLGLVTIVPLISKSLPSLSTLFTNFNTLNKQGDNIKPGTQIVTGIVLYYAAHQEYPEKLDVLVSDEILDEMPVYPISGLPYRYTVTTGGKDFKLCTPTLVSPEKCVTSKSKDFDL